jgi:hypothetical protein
MYEMQGPRSARPRWPADCSAGMRFLAATATSHPLEVPVTRLLDRFRSFPRNRCPSLVVNEFLQRPADLAQEVSRSNFKILWSSTGHLELSPAPAGISTGVSTGLSTGGGTLCARASWRALTGTARHERSGALTGTARHQRSGALTGTARRHDDDGAPPWPGPQLSSLLSLSRRPPRLPNSRWPAPAAVSATPRTAPISGSADRFHDSW